MRYQVNEIKLPICHHEKDLKNKIAQKMKLSEEEIVSYQIKKRSIDARKKPKLFYVYNVTVEVCQGSKYHPPKNVFLAKEKKYHLPSPGEMPLNSPPIIVGTGPAGLFCGYELAKQGYSPILIDRGASIEERVEEVETFFSTGKLNPESNVQFGEGGAGTFSDGKLNTLVKDPYGRNLEVLQIFVEHGAPKSILYDSKPHIGTDELVKVISRMRQTMEQMGATFLFRTKLVDIQHTHNKLTEILVENTVDHHTKTFTPSVLVLALGHSARDTFEMLEKRGFSLLAKAFAVGVRVEHPQERINHAQYGEQDEETLASLGASPYKLAYTFKDGIGVYSFCMCPGGYVVNASSEQGALAVNGMSYAKRDGKNANSAIVVSVSPEVLPGDSPLKGMAFQRKLEQAAFACGNGRIPVEMWENFRDNKAPESLSFLPQMKGQYSVAHVRDIFPSWIVERLIKAMAYFGTRIEGFDSNDVLVSGVESRTSSPIRIARDERCEHPIGGIFPCGEGAGYAGGIMSAAMDGLKVAESISATYALPPKKR